MRCKALCCFVLLSSFVLIILAEAKGCPVPLCNNSRQRGELMSRRGNGAGFEAFEHQLTHVRMIDYASFHRVFVTEIFKSNFRETIHGHYSIQLPQDASINNIDMRIGERRIEVLYNQFSPAPDYIGIIYNHIEDSAEIARLMDKDYPSTFAQPIPHIQPGEEVEISINYFEKVYAGDPIPYPVGGEEEFCETGILRKLDYRTTAVGIILMLIALYGLSLIIERLLTFRAAASQSRLFAARVNPILRFNRLSKAVKISGFYPKSPLANIMREVFKTVKDHPQNEHRLSELCGSARSRAIALSDAELRRGLRSLKTAGWLALMAGCLGTIFKLVEVFHSATVVEGLGLSAIAGGIADSFAIALWGLLIFVPAMWGYKYLCSKAAKIGVVNDKASWELLDLLLKRGLQERAARQLPVAIWSDC
jgi:biopolymer transport protein ExbB/TolQ